MQNSNRTDREFGAILAVAVVFIFAVVLFVISLGCRSTAPPCPEIVLPEVVEIPVKTSPLPLPTPRPPDLKINDVNPENTPAALEVFAADWHEWKRAFLEAVSIIEEHNKVVSPPP